MPKKAILIVLDGVGVGDAPDAAAYGDESANTIFHVNQKANPSLPNMLAMGFGNIPYTGLPEASEGCGAYGRLTEQSQGKDTTSGHWEMAGVPVETAFPTFPLGFPQPLIDAFERETGTGTLGNVSASGTEIIEALGEDHLRTGKLIVYTSADSVLQIAAHEEIVPPEKLYKICETARALLTGPYAVGRVIARPFIGRPGAFVRTSNRRDFSLAPPRDTLLDVLSQNGFDVAGVGKIEDIFAHRGLTISDHANGNTNCIAATLRMLERPLNGLVFVNLVDFDMLYGHRRDASGFAASLEEFDRALPEIQARMGEDDLLIITADHGCDPSFRGTDHTRERVPLLCWNRALSSLVDLGTRDTFSDIAATILDFFELPEMLHGTSFGQMIYTR